MRKIDYSEIFKSFVESEGYSLLSEYKTSKLKVKLRCDRGHEYEVKPNNFNNGQRCRKCRGLCQDQTKEEVLDLLKEEGYELLSEYENSRTMIRLRCNKGHEYNVLTRNFKRGDRCLKCSGSCPEVAEAEFIRSLDQDGYTLLSDYRGTHTKVKVRCTDGHEYETEPNNFKQGRRCTKCSDRCPDQAKERFIELIDQEGYKLLSDYVNNRTKVTLLCPEGHEWETVSNSFINGIRCLHCTGSTGQRLLQEMLLEHIPEEVIYNDRKVLGGLELDIYYPSLNTGIEYQGNYWHSLPERIERDRRKKKLCKQKGIKLMEVWDNDFLNDPVSISNIICNEILSVKQDIKKLF